MTLGDARDQLLGAAVLLETLLDLENSRASTGLIGLVHHHDIGQIEHDDLLQLQSRTIIRIHDQHSHIDDPVFLKRHRFLTRADRLYDDVIETGTDQFSQLGGGRGGRKRGLRSPMRDLPNAARPW